METFRTKSETETIELGKKFAENNLKEGGVVALYGDLGTGKTRFVQGICKAFNIHYNVSSPSFTIINEYKSEKITIYHFDFYRINHIFELTEIGFDEYIFSKAISIIEWADRVTEILPDKRYDIHFFHTEQENERIIEIKKNDYTGH